VDPRSLGVINPTTFSPSLDAIGTEFAPDGKVGCLL
jgi:hypothetical protein